MEPEAEEEVHSKDDDKDEELQNVNFAIPTTNSNLRRSERMNRGTISKYGKYYVHCNKRKKQKNRGYVVKQLETTRDDDIYPHISQFQ